jgi:hypothetical protein
MLKTLQGKTFFILFNIGIFIAINFQTKTLKTSKYVAITIAF